MRGQCLGGFPQPAKKASETSAVRVEDVSQHVTYRYEKENNAQRAAGALNVDREAINQSSRVATSPPARVPTACQTAKSTESRTNRTDPSAMHTFTPPVW